MPNLFFAFQTDSLETPAWLVDSTQTTSGPQTENIKLPASFPYIIKFIQKVVVELLIQLTWS